MLDTFKKRLKAKSQAAGANLSQKRIDALADRLQNKNPEVNEDDAAHDAAIDVLYDETDLKELASLDDYNRTKQAREEAEKKRKEQQKKKPQEESDDEPEEVPEEVPKWAQGLIDTVNKLQSEKNAQSMKDRVAGHEKLKGIDPKLYELVPLPAKDEEVDAWAERVAGVYGNVSAGVSEESKTFIPGTGIKGKVEKTPNKETVKNIVGAITQ